MERLRTRAPAGAVAEAGEPRLHYPLPGRPRIAVLGCRLRREEGVRCFVPWTCHQLMRLAPEALAGSLPDLLEAARLQREGFLELAALELPLVVFSRLDSGAMTAGERSLLWRAFGLPFFEQIRDAEGGLLAYECDARDGFHWVDEEAGAGVGRAGRCGCGRPRGVRTPASGRTGSAWRATTGL